MKDYRSVRDEIFRRAEVKKQNRRQKIVRGATVCLLLCLCLPVSLWAWQTGASLEEPPIYAPDNNAQGAPASGENEEMFQSAVPDMSGELWLPEASAEPEVEASEEPPMEEEPAPDLNEPEGSAPSLPQGVTVRLPDGSSLEILLFPIPGISQSESISKEAIGVIGVTVDGKWDPKQGYILITEGKRLPNVEGAGSISRLETILEEADLEYPSGSLTVEESVELLFMLYLYYL